MKLLNLFAILMVPVLAGCELQASSSFDECRPREYLGQPVDVRSNATTIDQAMQYCVERRRVDKSLPQYVLPADFVAREEAKYPLQPGKNIWEGRPSYVAWKDFPGIGKYDEFMQSGPRIRDIMRIYRKPRGSDAVSGLFAIQIYPYFGGQKYHTRFARDVTGELWQLPFREINYYDRNDIPLATPAVTYFSPENEPIPDEWQNLMLAGFQYNMVHPPHGWCGPRYQWSHPDDPAVLCKECVQSALSMNDVIGGRIGECLSGQCGVPRK